MTAYYNEFDPKAAAWLRELIKEGLIPDGEVDERDIREIPPSDLRGFEQHHFFTGIAGWPLALRLAGWPEDRPVFTGSCPCQPFSNAGKRKGTKDERHLWPAFRWLIAQLRPPVVFGEQVESKDGCEWLSGVRLDLEAIGYRVGASDLPAASVGSPHIRQRLFWVANSGCGIVRDERQPVDGKAKEDQGEEDQRERLRDDAGDVCEPCGMVQPNGSGWEPRGTSAETAGHGSSVESASRVGFWDGFDILPFQDGKFRRVEPESFPLAHGISGRVGLLRGYGNAIVPQVAAEFIGSFLEIDK